MSDQKNVVINNYTELQYHVMQLNAKKEIQETEIKRNVMEIYYSIHPANLVKIALNELSADTEIRQNIAKTSISVGADYILGKLFGRNSSIKGYITSILLGKVTQYVLNNHSDTLYTGISKGIDKLKHLFNHSAIPFKE